MEQTHTGIRRFKNLEFNHLPWKQLFNISKIFNKCSQLLTEQVRCAQDYLQPIIYVKNNIDIYETVLN